MVYILLVLNLHHQIVLLDAYLNFLHQLIILQKQDILFQNGLTQQEIQLGLIGQVHGHMITDNME